MMTQIPGASSQNLDSWFDRRFRLAWAHYTLYCFPFAGGAATYFSDWSDRFRGPVELVPIQLPGRGPRLAEPLPTAIEDVADQVVTGIAAASTRPLLFGHSMGAILAFEVARRLETLGRPAAHLFVSGRPAPPLARPLKTISQLPRPEFVQVLRDYGAASQEILANDELLEVLMPMMRGDFAMIEAYRYRPGPQLSCPISAWCGTNDPEVDPPAMQGWAAETTAGWRLFVRPGGHFFLSHHVNEITRAVHDAVARIDQCANGGGLGRPVDPPPNPPGRRAPDASPEAAAESTHARDGIR